MALPALATVSELSARLGRDLAAEQVRAEKLLVDASAAVRSYTGQRFTAGSSTARVKARAGRCRLPQRPVTAVTSVSVVGSPATLVPFTWTAGAGDEVLVGSQWGDEWYPVHGASHVDVVYSHGYEVADLPQEVVAVVCQVAGRALGRPADETGVQQESGPGYSYTSGPAAAAGPVGLMNDERAVLDRFSRQFGVVTFL